MTFGFTIGEVKCYVWNIRWWVWISRDVYSLNRMLGPVLRSCLHVHDNVRGLKLSRLRGLKHEVRLSYEWVRSCLPGHMRFMEPDGEIKMRVFILSKVSYPLLYRPRVLVCIDLTVFIRDASIST